MSKDYNPKMHSAEHILNQTMIRLFDCGRSFSAHIEKKKSKCDYHFNRNLTDEEILQIETKVNEVIKTNLIVSEHFYTKDEASKIVNLSKLPEDSGDVIRIIKIGDYDLCPCSGMHVQSTNEIGKFKIISSSFEENVLRIRFKLLENQTD